MDTVRARSLAPRGDRGPRPRGQATGAGGSAYAWALGGACVLAVGAGTAPGAVLAALAVAGAVLLTCWAAPARRSRDGEEGPRGAGYGPEGARLHAVRRGGGVGRAGRGGRGSRPRRGDHSLPKALWRAMQEDDVFNVAGAMAYFAFLSLPPTILVLFAMTGFFGGEQTAQWVTDRLTATMPQDAAAWIDTFVDNVVRTRAPGPFSVGLLLALWAASNVFMAVTRALNLAYDVDEPRSWIRQRALAVAVMLFFVVFFLIGSASLILGPQVAQALDLFGIATGVWNVVQWILPFLLVVGAFWIAYYVLPARDQMRYRRQILIGAVVGAAIWLLGSVSLRFYIANFGGYNETYGVLGGIIILMLWLYITMLVILMGGELAAELERRARG